MGAVRGCSGRYVGYRRITIGSEGPLGIVFCEKNDIVDSLQPTSTTTIFWSR